MPTFSDVHPGDPMQAANVQQVIDALKGTPAKGVALAATAVSDATNYALTLQNLDATNSRALNVLKSDGTQQLWVDNNGVHATLAPGTVTSSAIVDGTIATADLANAAVTNAKLASDTARLNLLVNGGFEVWQRGNGPFTGAGTGYSADRWAAVPGSGSTMSVSRDTANSDIAGACAAVTYTHSAVSYLNQPLTDQTAYLAGRTVTLSVRVKTSIANAVRTQFGWTNPTLLTPSTTFHTGNGQYQTLTQTITIPTGITGLFVYVNFEASCTAYVDNATLVVGSQAADYAPLHPADDLARCLRYYEVFATAANSFFLDGYNTAGATNYKQVPFRVLKAVTPTTTKNGTWQQLNAGQPSIYGSDQTGIALTATTTATGYWFSQPASAASMTAPGITVEANP